MLKKSQKDKIRAEFRKQFGICFNKGVLVDKLTQANIENYLIQTVEENEREIVEDICDDLIHIPIHSDMDLMAKEIRHFRKTIYERFINSPTKE